MHSCRMVHENCFLSFAHMWHMSFLSLHHVKTQFLELENSFWCVTSRDLVVECCVG